MEVAPKAVQVGFLAIPGGPGLVTSWRELEGTSHVLGVKIQRFDVKEPSDLEHTFERIARERIGGLIVPREPLFILHRRLLSELTAKHRLPAVFPGREFVEVGGLMSYAYDEYDLHKRVLARYVDRIFKGAKPADLPIEQPTKFELVINLKTAKALGLDQVIE